MQSPLTRLDVTYPGGSYVVHVGYDLLPDWRALSGLSAPTVAIADAAVAERYADRLPDLLGVVRIPPGEQHKTLATLARVYGELVALGLDRSGAILALGGGVTTDLAGFAAATYMRGVRLIQCPTTLLGMVDAALGGKTGVDLPEGKNLVGAFKQPEAVIADLETLHSLPAVEFAAGMAEVIKHGLIGDPVLFEALERQPATPALPPAQLAALVRRAIDVKRLLVQADPFERGARALLNLGHTFGHAVEQVSGYAVRHGEAVAMGLATAARVSAALGHCPAELPLRVERVLRAHGLPTAIPAELPIAALWAAMQRDKKATRGAIRFILLRGVGDCFVTAEMPLSLPALHQLATQQTPPSPLTPEHTTP